MALRLTFRELLAVIVGFALMLLEVCLRACTFFLPRSGLMFFYDLSSRLVTKPVEKNRMRVIQGAAGFVEMCEAFGYEAQEHVVQTQDGYLLGVHRICQTKSELNARLQASLARRRGRRPERTEKPVIYMHHGLMMNSEVWVCNLEAERQLPFILVERGYDVWFGNNRGNKYSKKHVKLKSSSAAFWDFSMDDFALRDIPDVIDYILETTKAPSLSYVGFSQGSAQAFATLSIHPMLNEKINLFVALAPAMSPRGLHNFLVDALMKSSPPALFLFFGRKAILPSAIFWQSIIYPPLYVKVLDTAMRFLFGWHSSNMSFEQKTASYYHLYSFASVKSLVHWFQVIRSGKFQMFDDEAHSLYGNFYRVARFPTRNITTPIVLMYGGVDSLVDIDVMLNELPDHTIAEEVPHYEHLDFLWARDVDKLVIPRVLHWLQEYSEPTADGKKGSYMIGGNHTSVGGSGGSPSFDDTDQSITEDVASEDTSAASGSPKSRMRPKSAVNMGVGGGFVPKVSSPTTQLSQASA